MNPGERNSSARLAKNRIRSSSGIALIATMMITTLLLGLIGATLFFTQIDLTISSNLKTGTQALSIAEAGLNHAIAVIPSGANFPFPLSGFPLTATFPSGSATSYTVAAADDNDGDFNPANDINQRIILTSVATGLDGASRTLKAYAGRSAGPTLPGAFYSPGTPGSVDFDGNSFLISGNDTNTDGTPGPNPAMPGIGTSTTDTTTTVTSELGGHESQVIGLGGTPAVQTAGDAPSPEQLAADLLMLPHVILPGGNYSGNMTFGTEALPQITHITGNAQIGGNVFGVGVLIVDGELELKGNFEFQGIIIALGPELDIQGNSLIFGSLWSKTSIGEIDIGGNASLYYSSQAIAVVNNNWGTALPKKAVIVQWLEVLD